MRNSKNSSLIKEIINKLPMGGALIDVGCMSMPDVSSTGGDV